MIKNVNRGRFSGAKINGLRGVCILETGNDSLRFKASSVSAIRKKKEKAIS
ncbi:hypothetical protein GVY41_09415 [Frigidibacter albus]|uniref:Uncharacterized protein n=1 Tax=Frigidibacter albus TaxID=1465486 RepID=A0A6L8VHY9_9RHOB|nr:hypothetical protein [Frigidibacter albus]NBE31212.1 hypothetical protein [Frigidibacter albus]